MVGIATEGFGQGELEFWRSTKIGCGDVGESKGKGARKLLIVQESCDPLTKPATVASVASYAIEVAAAVVVSTNF
jgi:hypothetical protein